MKQVAMLEYHQRCWDLLGQLPYFDEASCAKIGRLGNDRGRLVEPTTPADQSADTFHIDLGEVRRYLTTMTTTVSSKGQIVLPAELRSQDDIRPGQEFEVQRIDRGEYRLVRLRPPANSGVVDWLLACPEKDFFVPIESESTDTL